MHRKHLAALAAATLAGTALLAGPAAAKGGNGEQASRPPSFDALLYADGELYGTNLNGNLPVPTETNRSSYDDLYMVTNGVMGQKPVAEAAPGPGYNGGRWAVVRLTWADPDDAVLLTSRDQVAMYLAAGALAAVEAGVYFSCPLLPVK